MNLGQGTPNPSERRAVEASIEHMTMPTPQVVGHDGPVVEKAFKVSLRKNPALSFI